MRGASSFMYVRVCVSARVYKFVHFTYENTISYVRMNIANSKCAPKKVRVQKSRDERANKHTKHTL